MVIKLSRGRHRSRVMGPLMFLTLLLGLVLSEATQAARPGLPGTGDLDFNPAADTEGNHCLNRFGIDLNAVMGISEQFVIGRCLTVNSGEFYVPHSVWITNTTAGFPGFPLVYPVGYVPALPEPMDDFLSKVLVKFTVDDQKTYIFPGKSIAKLRTAGDLNPGDPLTEAPLVDLVARLRPVQVGSHVVRIDWVLTAEHCDGLGTEPGLSCLPAGESLIGIRRFQVVPGAAQAR